MRSLPFERYERELVPLGAFEVIGFFIQFVQVGGANLFAFSMPRFCN